MSVSKIRPLPAQRGPASERQERDAITAELLQRCCSVDDDERCRLLQRVAELNQPVADILASQYAGGGIPLRFLKKVAYEGLIEAARRYKPGEERDFLTFAVPAIKGDLRNAVRDLGWVG